MRVLSDSDLMHLWEGGMRRHPLDRALLALAAALPETPYERIADWPLGRRNQALAELRCACFGPRLQAWIACVKCGEKLEFELDGGVIAARGRDAHEAAPEVSIVVNHRTFRLPTSRDLARAAAETDPRRAAIRIVDNCWLAAPSDPQSYAAPGTSGVGESRAELWTNADLEEIGERMALADPLAETRLTLHCPNCANDWDETLDMVAFLWAEIEARARRLLRDIHALAQAYGWTEGEILSLSEIRRAHYIEMVQS
jgi:hypothetical protein